MNWISDSELTTDLLDPDNLLELELRMNNIITSDIYHITKLNVYHCQ